MHAEICQFDRVSLEINFKRARNCNYEIPRLVQVKIYIYIYIITLSSLKVARFSIEFAFYMNQNSFLRLYAFIFLLYA